jgi:hypothetical protein
VFQINVLEILRVGLSGFCFLLILLAFWLIRLEQQRAGDPRPGIIRIIYVFMAAIASVILLGGLGYLAQKQTVVSAGTLSSKTYLVENTTFLLDLAQWKAESGGPAIIRRLDFIKKVGDTSEDFVIPSYTSGDSIEWRPLSDTTSATFTETHAPDQSGKNSYEYRLPMGRQPQNHTELASSEFTFSSGFKNPRNEWWKAYALILPKQLPS